MSSSAASKVDDMIQVSVYMDKAEDDSWIITCRPLGSRPNTSYWLKVIPSNTPTDDEGYYLLPTRVLTLNQVNELANYEAETPEWC